MHLREILDLYEDIVVKFVNDAQRDLKTTTDVKQQSSLRGMILAYDRHDMFIEVFYGTYSFVSSEWLKQQEGLDLDKDAFIAWIKHNEKRLMREKSIPDRAEYLPRLMRAFRDVQEAFLELPDKRQMYYERVAAEYPEAIEDFVIEGMRAFAQRIEQLGFELMTKHGVAIGDDPEGNAFFQDMPRPS